MALRQMAIMPKLVNRGYESMAGQRGSTIDVPIPSSITVQTVTAANTPPSTADVAPTSVAIPLTTWVEAPFYLTDQDVLTAMEGTIPMQASEAVKALANKIDTDILSQYTGVYGYAGTAGTTPFASDLTAYTTARSALNKQLSPMDSRRVVLDTDAEANAINLRAFQDASWRSDAAGIIEGQIGRKLGADWFMDQNIPTHTAGTGTGYLVNNVAGYAVGDTTLAVDTGSGTLVAGDVITFASHTQTYAIVSSVGGGSVTSITITPGLKATVPDNNAITRKASHVVNLLFHRDAFAFASRPLESMGDGLGNIIQSAVDPVSGLTLRLEISREHKRTRFSYDILYGYKLVRAELAARIAG
jgi:hypothetical protein